MEGAFTTPALTSIVEPIFELGQSAAIALIEQIEGNKVLSEIQIPTSLMIDNPVVVNSANQIPYNETTSTINIKQQI